LVTYVIQANHEILYLDLETCMYIKIIAIFKSRNGRFRQNSHLFAAIQFNLM